MDIPQTIASIIEGMMRFLAQTAADPLAYSVVLFFYAIMAAVFLPVPVEVGLLLSPHTPVILLAVILGLGKMVGSVLVFYLGLGIGSKVEGWSVRWPGFGWLVTKSEWLVKKLHYLGLYLILSVPLMTDTVPLYIFSILNKQGVFTVHMFAFANLCAGITRASISLILLSFFGVDLIN